MQAKTLRQEYFLMSEKIRLGQLKLRLKPLAQ